MFGKAANDPTFTVRFGSFCGILKYDPDGHLLRAQNTPPGSSEFAGVDSLVADRSGNVYVTACS